MNAVGDIRPTIAGFAVDAGALPLEGGTDPQFGTVTWRTLVSQGRTPSSGMVSGVASFGPGGTLLPHRHTPPEIYFGLSGEGQVAIDGVVFRISPGVAIYIPADAEHAVLAGPEGLAFFYVFPTDSFEDVEYRFSPPPATEPSQIELG